jgi:hypothetical protein
VDGKGFEGIRQAFQNHQVLAAVPTADFLLGVLPVI